jgi:lipopolysaccharide transport system ATP-binding protein
LLLEHALAERDAFARARAEVDIEKLRRAGGTALIVSHEEGLLRQLCDEVWWLDRGRLEAKGDPGETLDDEGRPSAVWQGGAQPGVRVTVRFVQAVADPVVGIMIRNRIGLEVYGTNTELEGLKLGPRAAGDTIAVTFSFACPLCPQAYTLTAASHDPDGVWHDWMDDAVLVTVADSRYAAGVVNLRARVRAEQA